MNYFYSSGGMLEIRRKGSGKGKLKRKRCSLGFGVQK